MPFCSTAKKHNHIIWTNFFGFSGWQSLPPFRSGQRAGALIFVDRLCKLYTIYLNSRKRNRSSHLFCSSIIQLNEIEVDLCSECQTLRLLTCIWLQQLNEFPLNNLGKSCHKLIKPLLYKGPIKPSLIQTFISAYTV